MRRAKNLDDNELSADEIAQISALFGQGRYPELEAKAREMTTRHPAAGLAWKVLGASLGMQGKDSLRALQRAAALLPHDAEAYNNLASAQRSLGRFDAAAISCRRAIEIRPEFAEAHSNLGHCLRGHHQLDAAIISYRRALQIHPGLAEACNGLGNALFELGRPDEAVASYRQALELRPQYAEACQNLGNALRTLGQPDAAASCFDRALQLRPRYAEAHVGKGSALLDVGQAEAAVKHHRAAIAIRPDYPEAYNNLGNALLALGQPEQAARNYQLALTTRPLYAEAHSNLGNAQRSLKQFDAAVASCRRALEIKPDFAQAHNNLGNALVEIGQLDGAVASYRRALQLQADYPEAHNNLGSALLSAGRTDDAAASCEQALRLKPDFAEAHGNLGNALLSMGRLDEAVVSYQRALQIKPRYLEGHNNLTVALRQLGRPLEAEASCRRALELEPNSAAAVTMLGDLQADAGRFGEAEALYRRAISMQPDMAEAWSGVVRLRKLTTEDAAWVEQARQIASQPLAPRKQTHLRYAIAKYFDDVKEFGRAFAEYRNANELARQYTPSYEREQVTQGFDRLLQLYDRHWFASVTHESNHSARPVFIVGMPRSGTTLTEQILASHPAVFGAGELNFWHRASSRYQTAALEGHGGGLLKGMAENYLALLEGLAPGAERVVDKMPLNFQHLGLIHAAFPNARIIHTQRHPIDTCLSIYFQNFSSVHVYANDLEDLAHYYEQYRRVMDHWRTTLHAGALLEMAYEDLVSDQEGATRKMLDFIGLRWDARCLDFHRTERTILTASAWQARQRISRSSVQRWKRYAPFIGPLGRLHHDDAGVSDAVPQ